jgi:hypothetical protein
VIRWITPVWVIRSGAARAHHDTVTEGTDARQLVLFGALLFGALLFGADVLAKAESRYVEDIRREVLGNFDRRMHRARRRARSVGTGVEVVLIALVASIAVAGQVKQPRTGRAS